MSADHLADVGITPQPDDPLRILRGVGGRESVFTRRIDQLAVGDALVNNFEIEVGGMDYGFEINGILGMTFLSMTGAVIDLSDMTLEFRASPIL